MVNTSDDFSVFVKDSLKEMLGPKKRVQVHTVKHDRMNDRLNLSKTIGMKTRFECTRCFRSWSSACGVTQWYYKLDVHRSRAGHILGCSLYYKVFSYTQKCERCDG